MMPVSVILILMSNVLCVSQPELSFAFGIILNDRQVSKESSTLGFIIKIQTRRKRLLCFLTVSYDSGREKPSWFPLS